MNQVSTHVIPIVVGFATAFCAGRWLYIMATYHDKVRSGQLSRQEADRKGRFWSILAIIGGFALVLLDLAGLY